MVHLVQVTEGDMTMKKLADDGLEAVSGGTAASAPQPIDTRKALCPKQKKETMFNLYSGGRAICQECGEQIMM